MNYELTEECYELLLDDYNNGLSSMETHPLVA